MRKQIVIIGATPLCLFLAEMLDQSVARLVHIDVRWLTGPGQATPLALHPTVLGNSLALKTDKINHVRIGRVRIMSISLPDRRIITDKGVVNYDWLLIDQGQAIADELAAVMQAGGWRSPEMVARYTERLMARRGAMARLAEIQGRT